MIILNLRAGLGNQMFQYAYAKALAVKSGCDLKINLWWYNNQPKKDTFRYYGLNHFNVTSEALLIEDNRSKTQKIIEKVFKKIKRILFKESDYVYYPHLAKATTSKLKVVEGYWNTEKYFIDIKDIIKKEFTLKEELGIEATNAREEINAAEKNAEIPVLILVRRGDYITNQFANAFHGALGTDYFKVAVNEIKNIIGERFSKIRFFIACEDIDWVRRNITQEILHDRPFTCISRPGIKDYEEQYLMSLCHHFILSNSTFCWWSAWLSDAAEKVGTKKIVIGPKRWVANPKVDTRDVMPEDWIRI